MAVEDSSLMNQENMPLVTAVIPVYNHEKYVVESIRSILNQTYQNLELIVLNDGSKDRSHEMVLTLVEECKRRFVRFEYINRENIGLTATLNQALAWARGDYLSALASDDVALPEKIEVLVDALEAKGPTYAAAFGNAWIIDDAGQRVRLDYHERISENADGGTHPDVMGHYTRGLSVNYKGEEFGTYPSLIAGNYMPAMSNIVRTNAIREAGGWTPGNVAEDVEMWLKLSKKFKFFYVDQPVALYRWHQSNSSKILTGKVRCAVLVLLAREKAFCFELGLKKIWQEQYTGILSLLLSDKTVPFSRKVAAIDIAESWAIVYWFMRRTAKKMLIALHIHQS
jgi:alpha-1,3-rhamnosyltransferase